MCKNRVLLFFSLLCFASCTSNTPEQQNDPCSSLKRDNWASSAYADPLWSPDGDSILFAYYPHTAIQYGYSGNKYLLDTTRNGLYSVRISTGEVNLVKLIGPSLSQNSIGGLAQWVPSKSFILTEHKGWYCAMSTDGSSEIQLVQLPEIYFPGGAAPDGTKLLYAARYNGDEWVHVVNIDGSFKHNIYKGYQPSWLQDNTIASIIGGDGITRTILGHYDTTGRFLDTLCVIPTRIELFRISPDGKYVAFTEIRKQKSNVAVILSVATINGANYRVLESEFIEGYYWCWSPFSDAIAYTKLHPCVWSLDNGRIWMVSLEGRKRQLTFSP